jgi:hypothetical protein
LSKNVTIVNAQSIVYSKWISENAHYRTHFVYNEPKHKHLENHKNILPLQFDASDARVI